MLRSFVPVAPRSHFPIQNLPYGVFRPRAGGAPRIGVAIGDFVLDARVLAEAGLLNALAAREALQQPTLNAFMALGRPAWHETRRALQHLLNAETPTLRDNAALRDAALHAQSMVEMLLPAAIGDYTDFYSSREHATHAGMIIRKTEAAHALLPNWLHLPVAYHGRASSVVVSGTEVRRPRGQVKPTDAETPVFSASARLDFELEMGYFIGPGNALGQAIPIEQATEHIFGMALVNDWSARDIQRWEYQPLGPFLSKNFITTVAPWVVALEALEPFRVDGPTQDPAPLPYLQTTGAQSYDIHLEAWLQGEQMPEPCRLTRTNFKHLYWSVAQQVAHHTVNGCNLRPGDLLATGTISGPGPEARGSLLELAWGGAEPVRLPNGETRIALRDGDTVTLTGWCEGEGYRVGFGEVRGKIAP